MALDDFTAKLGTGEEQSLAAYRSQALLIVKIASNFGFTPQYKGLQALHAEYAPRGFAVLAFPRDQFGHQESGSNQDIAAFCERGCAVTFPLFAKIEVNGPRAHPLYVWLKQQKGGLLGSGIKWNFTKFLVDKAGIVRARVAPTTKRKGHSRDTAALV